MALLGVCATFLATAIAPQSFVAWQLSYFVLLLVLIIPVHELGHAIAGALVGYRITAIAVGAGPPLVAFRALGVAVQINLLPLGGMTMALPRRPYRSLRLRQWIMTAGGPLANVLIYVALRRVYGAALGDTERHPLASTASLVNWAIAAMNLIPFRTAEGTASDGYVLFTIPFWSATQVQDAYVLSYAVRVTEALSRGDLAAARPLAEEAYVRYPESPLAHAYLGTIRHRERRHEDALRLWREGLAKARDPRPTAMLKNNIAWAQIVLGRAEDLPEAERLSGEARAAFPDLPSLAGTRGTVLLRLGRAGEALPLLMTAETAAADGVNKAYNAATIASALAALGRRDEAVRKLEEARRADPDCELIARAEADISAGPLSTATAPGPAAGAAIDAGARTVLLRAWRRDARILAFVALVAISQRLGVDLVLLLILSVLSLAPELSGIYALAGFELSAAVLHAVGFTGSPRLATGPAGRAEWVLLALAFGGAASWLIARHRRIGPEPPSRTPAVLGWIVFGLDVLLMLPPLLRLAWDGTPLAWHDNARSLLGQLPALIALSALMASRSRRHVRRLALLPAAIGLLAMAPASSWYLNRVAFAEVPEDGAPLALGDPTPAQVVRSARVAGGGHTPKLSPGGRAFVLEDFEARPGGGEIETRSVLRVGDFEGHRVDVEGTDGAFLDDERLIVLRRRPDAKGTDLIAEVRPFQSAAPIWVKPLSGVDVYAAALRVDGAAGEIFIVGHGSDDVYEDAPLAWRTTADPTSAVEPSPVRIQAGDQLLATALRGSDGDAALVLRGRQRSPDLVWRTAAGERRLAGDLRLECPDPRPGAARLWCLTGVTSIPVGIDAREPRIVRRPGTIAGDRPKMLDGSLMAVLDGDDIHVLDLELSRGATLRLPSAASRARRQLVDGGLATLERAGRGSDSTIAVYELPVRLR